MSLYVFVPETIEKMCCFWLENGAQLRMKTRLKFSRIICDGTRIRHECVPDRTDKDLTVKLQCAQFVRERVFSFF